MLVMANKYVLQAKRRGKWFSISEHYSKRECLDTKMFTKRPARALRCKKGRVY